MCLRGGNECKKFLKLPMDVQAADLDLLEPGTHSHCISALLEQNSLRHCFSSARSFFRWGCIGGLTTLTVRNSFLMSDLPDFNTARHAHTKLENFFPAKLICCLSVYSHSNLGALCLGLIPMGSRSLEALIKSGAKMMCFTVKYFVPIMLFFPLKIDYKPCSV